MKSRLPQLLTEQELFRFDRVGDAPYVNCLLFDVFMLCIFLCMSINSLWANLVRPLICLSLCPHVRSLQIELTWSRFGGMVPLGPTALILKITPAFNYKCH